MLLMNIAEHLPLEGNRNFEKLMFYFFWADSYAEYKILAIEREVNLNDSDYTKKWSFPLRISSENVTKSAGNCGFGHIY